jgi:hypothetical protein
VRKGVTFLASTAAVVTMMVSAAVLPASADPAGICPDGHVLLPTYQGDPKDKNENGMICQKVNMNGELTGGPDDRVDDFTP